MLVGGNDEDSFFVDAVSLETGTVKLRGWNEDRDYSGYQGRSYTFAPDPYVTVNTLSITGLNHGDSINFNDENLRAIASLKFDYSQHASIMFDNIADLGSYTFENMEIFGIRRYLWKFDVSDIYGIKHNTINSELLLKYDYEEFDSKGRSTPADHGQPHGGWWVREYLKFNNFTENKIDNFDKGYVSEYADLKAWYFHDLNSPVPLLGNAQRDAVDPHILRLFGGSDS